MAFEEKDWLMIAATVAGPILAVQAQKVLERYREHRSRKSSVFASLMATRAERVSPEHVRSLNMIDLSFHGRQVFGFNYQTKTELAVVNAWKEYHDHLSSPPEDRSETNAVWARDQDSLFIALLSAMAADLRFPVDAVKLKKGAYSPIAHGNIEAQNREIREAVVKVLSGKTPVKMDVVGFPSDPEALAAHKHALDKLGVALSDGSLKVDVQHDKRQGAN